MALRLEIGLIDERKGDMVVVQSRFRVANGLEAAVRDAFLARPRLVDVTRGFLGLETFTDATHPEIFYLITRWVDEPSYTRWHGSADHRHSHAGMPKGLKLDPSFTQVIVGERIEPAGAASVLDTIVADSGALVETFLAHSSSTCCAVVSAEGTFQYCNGALDELLEQRPGGAIGQPIARFLTATDAVRVAGWAAEGRGTRSTAVLLNFLRQNGMPFTLRCHIDAHGDQIVIIGEPDDAAQATMQQLLVDLNNQLVVAARENARQKRELEQSHWQLKKIGELLPICMDCGKVKTGATTWEDLRTFFQQHGQFLSHGYCPECVTRLAEEWDLK
jgi:heme-degrading monooxygenase HmoA/ribosomal protein L32